ncbi:MAG: hypothetical protein AAF533_26410 [Acidobacteriota bacterium]
MRLHRSHGTSLVELLVATLVASVVVVFSLQVVDRLARRQDEMALRAEMQQGLTDVLRLLEHDLARAGFLVALDEPGSSLRPDEAFEHASRRAFLVRGDTDLGDAAGGRELELESGDRSVTVGHDEVRGWAVGRDRPDDPGRVLAELDLGRPRDAWLDDLGQVHDEERIELTGLAPELGPLPDGPWTLHRLRLSRSGRLVAQPVLGDLAELSFTYLDHLGRPLEELADPLVSLDEPERRRLRARVHAVQVELTLRRDRGAGRVPLSMARSLTVTTEHVARPVLGTTGPPAPTELHACSGQCGFLRVEWSATGPADENETWEVDVRACDADLVRPGERLAFHRGIVTGGPEGGPTRRVLLLRHDDFDADPHGRLACISVRRVGGPSATMRPLRLVDRARPAPADRLVGSGLDPDDVGWPRVIVDGAWPVPVVDTGEHAARDLALRLRWQPPSLALPVTGRRAPSSCHAPPDGPDGTSWLEELDVEGAATYVFAAVQSDPTTWGPPGHRVEDPADFLPAETNLLGRYRLPLSDHAELELGPAEPGTVHVLRLRHADACWPDEDGDGRHDRQPTLAAWMTDDELDPDGHRHLSDVHPAIPAVAAPARDARGTALPPERPARLWIDRRLGHPRRLLFTPARWTAPEDRPFVVPDTSSVPGRWGWVLLARRLVPWDPEALPARRPTAAELDFGVDDPGVEIVSEIRLTQRGLATGLVDDPSESLDGRLQSDRNPRLLPPSPPTGSTWAHRLFVVQVRAPATDEALPSRLTDDGITDDPARLSRGGPVFLDCTWQQTLRVTSREEDELRLSLGPAEDCARVTTLRVLALGEDDRPLGMSRTVSTGGACELVVPRSLFVEAGPAWRRIVELGDDPRDVGRTAGEDWLGCRQRVDLLTEGELP